MSIKKEKKIIDTYRPRYVMKKEEIFDYPWIAVTAYKELKKYIEVALRKWVALHNHPYVQTKTSRLIDELMHKVKYGIYPAPSGQPYGLTDDVIDLVLVLYKTGPTCDRIIHLWEIVKPACEEYEFH